MTLGDSIMSILLANSTVSGLVGTRIYPQELPLQCTLPALVYSFPSNPFKIHMRSARCQISCYATSYNGRENLRQAVEDALIFFSGLNNGIVIEIIFPIGQNEHVKDSTSELNFAPIDFRVNYYTN